VNTEEPEAANSLSRDVLLMVVHWTELNVLLPVASCCQQSNLLFCLCLVVGCCPGTKMSRLVSVGVQANDRRVEGKLNDV